MTTDDVVAFAAKIANAKREREGCGTAAQAYALALNEAITDPCFSAIAKEEQEFYMNELNGIKGLLSAKVAEIKG